MRRYQVSTAGGHVVHKASTDLPDHVNAAIRHARQGLRCWLKSRDPDDPLSQFYVIEFRLREHLEVTCFESSQIISPDHATTPPWIFEAATVARRIINPNELGVSP